LVRECRLLLSDIVLQVSIVDRWNWHLDNNGGYYVCSVYRMFTVDDSQVLDMVSKFIWHKHVPTKVSILAWRLIRNRLPTKSNLMARGIISHEAQMYVTGCGEVETTHHLFVSYPIFRELWPLVRGWIWVSGAEPLDIHDHFHHFLYL